MSGHHRPGNSGAVCRPGAYGSRSAGSAGCSARSARCPGGRAAGPARALRRRAGGRATRSRRTLAAAEEIGRVRQTESLHEVVAPHALRAVRIEGPFEADLLPLPTDVVELRPPPLAEAAQEYLDQLPDSPGPGAPRPFADPASKLPELLPRLLWSWGVQPTRASPREAPGGRIAVLCGLEAIHRVFAHRSAVEQALGGKDRRQGKQVAPVVIPGTGIKVPIRNTISAPMRILRP